MWFRKKTRADPVTIWLNGADSRDILCPTGYTPLAKNEEIRRCTHKIADLVSNITIMLIYYLHNKAFEYCIGNVKAVEDADERVRFEKVAPKKRMDLFDATVIACKQYIDDKDKKNRLSGWF